MVDLHTEKIGPDPCLRAKELLKEGRHDEVVRLLEPLTILEPDDADIWRLLGMAQASLGDLADAVDSLDRAVRLEPNVAQNHFNLAVALQAKGDAERARAEAERALELDPHYTLARQLFDELPAPPLGALRNGGAAGAEEARSATADPDLAREQEREAQRLRERLEYEATLGEWSWDGFLWGAGAPFLWLAWNGPIWLAFAVFFGERVFVYILAGVGPAALWFSLLRVALAAYLGWRGNILSWNRRSFRSVKDFRACHRIWLMWALVPVVLGYATYRIDIAIAALRGDALPRTAPAASTTTPS